jgi:GNAT superfamily N-acetyltransferase
VIRRATLADVPAIVELAAAMHAESPHHQAMNLNAAKVAHALSLMLARPLTALLLVIDTGGVIDGGAIAHIESPWFSDDLIAQEVAMYVTPAKRGGLGAARLVAHMDAWARAMGARLLLAGCTTGITAERTIALYEHLGFARVAVGVERRYH